MLAAAALPLAALASTIIPHTLEDRVRASDRVSLVTVLSSHTVAENGDPRRMHTETQVLVADDLKGEGPQRVTVVQLGGTLGPWAAHVPGDAQFHAGESAVLFLKCRAPSSCSLVALGEGKLQVDGSRVHLHDLFTGKWSWAPLDATLARLKKAVTP